VKGIPIVVTIDDYMVYGGLAGSGNLDFDAAGNDGSLWAVMMEKIWAKASGNYDNIEYGEPVESFAFVLGAPS
jgi:hypothetical protein